MADSILFDVEEGVAFITFNRPQRLNALDLGMATSFRDAVVSLGKRSDVRVVVLRGAGGAFMAGGDVSLFHGEREAVAARIAELIECFHHVTMGLQRMPQPVIASVHGAVAGGGFSLALGADIRIAADTTAFIPAYLRLGTSPDGGGTYFLSRLIGPSRAFELFVTGETLTAARAQEMGIVNRVVPSAELAGETARLARSIASGPAPAVSNTKALFAARDLEGLAQQLAAEKESFLACVRSPDFVEGVTAFLEKRPPRFSSR